MSFRIERQAAQRAWRTPGVHDVQGALGEGAGLGAAEQVEGLDRLLSDILSAHLAQMGVRQNDDMRKISAWAAMAAVPTMVAGIYGMNFDHMPELHWPWTYPVVVALMGLAVYGLYRLFKRRGWL
ncbi:hypothetical protein SBADM41S_10037 [Streptomyces badius]